MSRQLLPLRLWHGCHTMRPELPSEKEITGGPDIVVPILREMGFSGELGVVLHSCMPQNPQEKGDVSNFLREVQKIKAGEYGNLPFSILSALEMNICREAETGHFSLDGMDWRRFDVLIASFHQTPQCGWGEGTLAEEVHSAYVSALPRLAVHKRGCLGHAFFYAGGEDWLSSYYSMLHLAADAGVAFGLFVPNELRRNPNWTRGDLARIPVLRPGGLAILRDIPPHLRFTLDFDCHELPDTLGLNARNLLALSSLLREERVHHLFCD